MNLSSIHEDLGLNPGLTQWVKDSALLWPAVAALTQPLAWELPYGAGAALKKPKKKKNYIKCWGKVRSDYVNYLKEEKRVSSYSLTSMLK